MSKTYGEKRNFSVTSEPEFGSDVKSHSGELKFVIQRHHASHLHYDFRLECDGALKSWAIPKGPSLNPKTRRGAFMVEDHPIDYANFEGQIPKGQYGGGEVLIWDEGVYRPEGATGDREHDEALVREGLAKGKLDFEMQGQRLRGGFVLIRTKKDDQWLLIKRTDAFSETEDHDLADTSIRSGRTAEDLREGRHPAETRKAPKKKVAAKRAAPVPKAPAPMVATEVDQPFDSDEWTFEVKLDGIRAMLVKDGDGVKVVSRNGNDITHRFSRIAEAVGELPVAGLVLDGEIVLFDEKGQPNFQMLMDAYHGEGKHPGPVFFAFDLLYYGKEDLREAPLSKRRAQLETIALEAPLRLHDSLKGQGKLLYAQAIEHGFEGIVAKRLSSPYREATRSDDWRKIKRYHTEEFLVGGYTKGTGAREDTLGSLLLGRLDGSGHLQFVGNVGGGFSDEDLQGLRRELDKSKLEKSPFVNKVVARSKPTFSEPKLVAEVRFMNWTRDDKLRFPIFQRLRPDVDPKRVTVSANPPMKEKLPQSDLLSAFEGDAEELNIAVEGQALHITSANRELWPGMTKRDLLRYYVQTADVLLTYLRDRPLTFVRYPDGVEGEGFFQRHWDKGLPDFVRTVEIWSDSNEGVRRHLVCDNLATLLWLGQISTVEVHPWHSRIVNYPDAAELSTDFRTDDELEDSVLAYPDYLVCDLDPNIRSGKEKPGADPELNDEGWRRTVEVALKLRETLNSLGLRGYLKTTGKTGLHVYVPLLRIYRNEGARDAAKTIGEFLMKLMPKEITMERALAKRPDRVFFDANMNGFGRTLCSAYSPRPVPGARVSMPIEWDQLEKVRPEDFTILTVPKLLATRGDVWATMLNDRQRLLPAE